MKQLVQDFRSGALQVVDVPAPTIAPGCLLVANAFSVVSTGTERATVEMGQASWVGKARQRPELARQVLMTLKREGVVATLRKVRSRLDQWKQLGYASAGTVLEVGTGVSGFSPGDRVACGGQDYASHAEIVLVPQHLCARVPAEVPLSHAAFTTLGAIALQGVRRAEVQVGETVAVIGLGLIGRLTVQILRAAGCRVVGHDIRPDALAQAGVEPAQPDTADAVIVTAATESSEPLRLAGELCRDRGRVVLVGVTGTAFPYGLYYEKELELRLSRSYGPGRYDPMYEEYGVDYPIGYVRWTEQRNMEAFLQLLAGKQVDVQSLITHELPIEEAPQAYKLIADRESSTGVLLRYQKRESPRVVQVRPIKPAAVVLGVIGAGHFAQGVLLPLFRKETDVSLHTVCTATGANAKKAQEKFGFSCATTDWRTVVADPAINTVLIATRHNLHAEITCAALRAGKTVWCEKPLALSAEELAAIEAAIAESGNRRLHVGFNRRFAPMAEQIRALPLPLLIRYRVSVQPLPADHWLLDPLVGGGRILGEVCHFVDFLQCVARARPISVFAQGSGGDNVQVALRFANGSVGSVDYFDAADPRLPKEYVEAFGGGRQVIVRDVREKGHAEQVRQFVASIRAGRDLPIPLDELVASTRATLAIVESLRRAAVIIL